MNKNQVTSGSQNCVALGFCFHMRIVGMTSLPFSLWFWSEWDAVFRILK